MLKKLMKKAIMFMAVALVAMMTLGTVTVSAATQRFVDPGFETGTMGKFSTQGNNIKTEIITDDVHSGDYALKVTGRKTADEMPFQSLTADQIVMGEWYEFSVWVKPSYTVWCALVVTPWAIGNETGDYMWNDSYGDQKVCEAGVWTQLKYQYRFVVEDNKLYVENEFDRVVCKNHAGSGDVTLNYLEKVDFKVNAEPGADVWIVDDFSLTLVDPAVDAANPFVSNDLNGEQFPGEDGETEEPTETEGPTETEEPTETEGPTETEEQTETEDQTGTEEPDDGSNAGLYIGIGVVAVIVIAAVAVVVIRSKKGKSAE